MTREAYLADPCGTASIPYWKGKSITLPEGMIVLHHREYLGSRYRQYTDEPYFRLIHDLEKLNAPVLPLGYSLCAATLPEFAAHINSCYDDIGVTERELQEYMNRSVYDAALWLAVRDDRTGEIVATGIGELDREIGEGILEWIQVSREHRGKGLGGCIVSELLWRMKDKCSFVTVSGRCDNPTAPESLYRRCGFAGNDIWHVLKRRKNDDV